jgi:hypothetical protein
MSRDLPIGRAYVGKNPRSVDTIRWGLYLALGGAYCPDLFCDLLSKALYVDLVSSG